MDFMNLISASGLNPSQIMPMIMQLGPKIPEFLEKISVIMKSQEEKAGLKNGERLFHSVAMSADNKFFIYGLVVSEIEGKAVIVRQSYRVDCSHYIDQIKLFLPNA